MMGFRETTGGDLVEPGHVADGAHHDERPYCDDLVDVDLLLHELSEGVGHQAVHAVAPVVGGHEYPVAEGPHLVFEDEQLLVAGADDPDERIARLPWTPA